MKRMISIFVILLLQMSVFPAFTNVNASTHDKQNLLSASLPNSYPVDLDASFTTSSSTIVLQGYNNAVYYKDYSFTVTKNQCIRFCASSNSFDTVLMLLDANKKPIIWSNNVTLSNRNSSFTHQFPIAGTYYLRVSQMTKTVGNYNISAICNTENIAFSENTVEIASGKTQQLHLVSSPNNLAISSGSWVSSNTKVASVSSSGVVTGKSVGTAVISFKNAITTASCKVIVKKPITQLSFENRNITIYETRAVTNPLKITPADATDAAIEWSVINSNISSRLANGDFYGTAAGSTAVFATASNNKQAAFTITVEPLEPDMAIFRRIAGQSRILTAIEISKEGWDSSKTVVLANAAEFADSLCAIPLASKLDAPILLTYGDTLEGAVDEQIKALGAENVIILGGNMAISNAIERNLKGYYNVTRLYGQTRYETSAVVSNYLTSISEDKPDTAIIVTGTNYADALSISSYSGICGYPILYANGNLQLNESVAQYLKDDVSNILIIGGELALPESVVTQITDLGISKGQISRLFGKNRFYTSLAISQEFDEYYENDVMITTGLNFPDALAGGVLATKLRTPVILSGTASDDAIIPELSKYIKNRNPKYVYILGGENAVSTAMVTKAVD